MWFEENQDVGGILIFRIKINECEGFSIRTEQIFTQKCHELGEKRFSVISQITSFIVNKMEAEEKTEAVSFSSFERNDNISPVETICDGPIDSECINIMVEGKDLEQTVKGEPIKILIRTNVETKERFIEALRKVEKL